jgi:ATP-dependent Clp protease protease subunit
MSRYKQDFQYKDIGTVLLENRIINLVGQVNDELAYSICSALMVLDEEDNTKPIQLFINSPGGSVMAGLSIIDTMNHIKSPVYTVVTGLAASMGAAILSAGEKGHRIALPNATVMLHQVSAGEQGNIQDMRVGFEFTEKLNKKLLTMIAANCGKSVEQFEKDTMRDKWLFADEALKYGIVDEVAVSSKQPVSQAKPTKAKK